MKRRFSQITVRTAIALLIASSVVLAMVASYRQAVWKRNQAVQIIHAQGAGFDVDDTHRFAADSWLNFVTGPDPYRDAREFVHYRPMGADLYECVRTLNDSGVRALGEFPALEVVTIVREPINEDALVCLSRLPRLRALTLIDLPITDEGLRYLSNNAALEELKVESTAISDAGFIHLKGLQKLKRLILFSKDITGAGLVFLKDLPDLEELDLSSTHLNDAAVAHLKDMPRLVALDLTGTDVTDASVEPLSKLAHLRELYIIGSKMSTWGKATLKDALPKGVFKETGVLNPTYMGGAS